MLSPCDSVYVCVRTRHSCMHPLTLILDDPDFLDSHPLSHSCHAIISTLHTNACGRHRSREHKHTTPSVSHVRHASKIKHQRVVWVLFFVFFGCFLLFKCRSTHLSHACIISAARSESRLQRKHSNRDQDTGISHSTGAQGAAAPTTPTFERRRLVHVWVDALWLEHAVLSYDPL